MEAQRIAEDSLDNYLDSYISQLGSGPLLTGGTLLSGGGEVQLNYGMLGDHKQQGQGAGSFMHSLGSCSNNNDIGSLGFGGGGGSDQGGLPDIATMQALLRAKQQQQGMSSKASVLQQLGAGHAGLGSSGSLGGLGNSFSQLGNSNGAFNLMRPTSLQEPHPASAQLGNLWGSNMNSLQQGTVTTASGQQLQSGFSNHQQPLQLNGTYATVGQGGTLRPASDSLLVRQGNQMPSSAGFQGLQGRLGSLSGANMQQTAGQAVVQGLSTGHGHGLGHGHKHTLKTAFDPSLTAEHSNESSDDDDSGRKGKGGGSGSRRRNSMSTTSVQEKNRSAQRRFRQRQKEKMQFLEKQTDALTSQVEKLHADNDSLRTMNSMLEKVLNLREEHISNLQEAAKIFEGLSVSDTRQAGAGSTDGGGSGAGAASSGGVNASGAGSGFGGGNGSSQVKAEPGSGAPGALPLLATGGHMLPPSLAASPARFSAESIKAMSAEDVIDAWKENLKELSRYVVVADSSSTLDPGLVSRMTTITAGMSELVHKVAMIQPLNIKRLLATNMELRAMVPVGDAHWARVLAVLQLNDQQKRDLLGSRERYMQRIEPIMQERQAILSNLPGAALPRTMACTDICSASLACHEGLERLRSNLLREHNANMEFVVYAFKSVLNLVQVAKAAVHSYPYYPDVLAISNLIAASSSQPSPTTSLSLSSQQQQRPHSNTGPEATSMHIGGGGSAGSGLPNANSANSVGAIHQQQQGHNMSAAAAAYLQQHQHQQHQQQAQMSTANGSVQIHVGMMSQQQNVSGMGLNGFNSSRMDLS